MKELSDKVSEKETDKRMTDALKRALAMPPAPHKAKAKRKKMTKKPLRVSQ